MNKDTYIKLLSLTVSITLFSILFQKSSFAIVSEEDMPRPSTNSGVIQWGQDACAVPIGPHTLLATRHGSGSANWGFQFGDQYFIASEWIPSPYPELDLGIIKVNERLPGYWNISRSQPVVEQMVTMVGRGFGRGTPYLSDPLRPPVIQIGWNWSATRGPEIWGTSRLIGVGYQYMQGRANPIVTTVFRNPADPLATQYEASPTMHDSGSALLINHGSEMRLLAIVTSLNGTSAASIYENSGAIAIRLGYSKILRWIRATSPEVSICLPDFDGNDSVSVDDIFSYLNAWSNYDPSADWNGDDQVGVNDIFSFLNSWFVGC